MFEKSLNDMIKGIRASPAHEGQFISKCLSETRHEASSTLSTVKQHAVLKLVFLHMLGYDTSWATFRFVDVMSCPKFLAKRIGSLAAAQSFHSGTEVILLTTNLFRKALASPSSYEVSLAIGCLATIATRELARDLIEDVSAMLTSSRPLVRKKAVLAVYMLVRRTPEWLETVFPKLREKLDDPSPVVVTCTINVLTELAADQPTVYLGLAPALYKAPHPSKDPEDWQPWLPHHCLFHSGVVPALFRPRLVPRY